MNRDGPIAFVPPRYGDTAIGGAEAVIREAARGLASRGWAVEVLTTCAADHYTWANELPAGTTSEDGVTVRRFPVAPGVPEERARLETAILQHGGLSLAEQERWMNAGLRVPDLFHHLLDHRAGYRGVVLGPYMFWTTFACAQLVSDRSILMPCLHDEPYAGLEIYRPLLSSPRGVWFLSEPEHALAHRLHDLPARHAVTGSGISVPDHHDADGFRRRHDIDGPFVLYAGRREEGKGWDTLLDWYAGAVRRHGLQLRLVTIGTGQVNPPSEIAGQVVDLGPVDDRDRDGALAAASAYLQPSRHESFSRTVMEAWLAGTLVIANGASAVVRWHCERSGAGLLYDDELELGHCLRFVEEAPDAARAIAARGRRYVEEHYSWPHVLDSMEQLLEEWLCGS